METPKSGEQSARPDPEELKELLEQEDSNATATNSAAKSSNSSRGLDFLYDIPLQVSVEVGRTRILLKELLSMSEGYVIELEKLAGEPLDLYVNDRLIAHGEAVLVGDKFGIRLTDVISKSDRVEKLG
ncbi:MAG TPA: flagellar motor switch protein FliN [Desulfopila sp.]|nr:flagellar motor switch protein FliN [Desulfopila sp.]